MTSSSSLYFAVGDIRRWPEAIESAFQSDEHRLGDGDFRRFDRKSGAFSVMEDFFALLKKKLVFRHLLKF